MIRAFLLTLFISVSAWADLSQCPTYTPPSTIAPSATYHNLTATSAEDGCQARLAEIGWSSFAILSLNETSPSTIACEINRNGSTIININKYQKCPDGYRYPSTGLNYAAWTNPPDNCSLYDNNLVNCPPVTCTAKQSVGLGGADASLVCLDGCVIKPRGMSAAEIDASGTEIGIKISEWEQTGSPCVAGGTIPVASNININQPNCVTNGQKTLCVSKEKPGCGIVNGKEWCPDKVGCGSVNGQRVCVADDGGCTPVGGLDFACTKNANPPNPPNNEPPPVIDFKAHVPVQDAPAPTGGNPSTGAVPNSSGSDTGGTAPVTIGHYPGNSGNGTGQNPDNGGNGGNIDTSGLAKESSLQSLGGLVAQIRDSLGGSLSGSGFSASTPGSHDNVNLSPEVIAKQTELSTKLAQVKAEFGQLLSFGSSSNAQALQCPANSGFTFYGTTISLCTQSVLSATATIGNVLIFLAFVVSLFILLS